MVRQLATLPGEQLLLMRILGGPAAERCINGELDRRAIQGPPSPQTEVVGPPAKAMSMAVPSMAA